MTWIGRRLEQHRVASMTDPVAGTLQVTAASFPPAGQNVMYSNYRLTGVISAPGVPPTAVEQHGVARVSRWPQAGAVLPVTVDRAEPTAFVISWDEVPSAAQQALADARDLALHEQTNLDFGVMRKAIDADASAPGAPDWLAQDTPSAPEWASPPPITAGQPAPGEVGDSRPEPQVGSGSAAEPPASGAPGSGPPGGPPVPGTVVAVYPVPAPGALAPPGGIWDLSVRTAHRTVLVRASCATDDERARVTRVGATVTVALGGSGDVATLIN